MLSLHCISVLEVVPRCLYLYHDMDLRIVDVVHWVVAGACVPESWVTGHTVVVTGMRVVVSKVLLAGQSLTFGGHFTTV